MSKSTSAASAEIIGSRLAYIATQMSEVMRRTAHSHVAREASDLTATLHAPNGDLIAQALNSIPMHLCGASEFLRNFLKIRPAESWEPTTIMISNDPYMGGQHLPDISIVAPYFFDGVLECFLVSMLHHTDIGGATAGGIVGDAKDIYSTGLRIPIVPYNSTVEEIIRANVRVPETVLGDLRAQLACLEFGKRRLDETYRRYGSAEMREATRWLLDYSERRVRQAIARIPDGTFELTEYIDDDGVNLHQPLPIRVKLAKLHDEITVDFSGSSEQTGTMNSPLTCTLSSVNLSLRMFFDDDIPNNEGCTKPIKIVAPPGSINNPVAPAGVNPRATVCHRQEEAIIGGMAYLTPERCRAASYGCSPTFIVYGTRESNQRRFVLVAGTIPGGMGARPGLDGEDAISCDLSNTRYINVETIEQSIPLLYHRQELRKDSGGPGRYRGGMSARQVVEALQPMLLTMFADRQDIPAFGLLGGDPGAVAEYVLNPGTAGERVIHSKATNVSLEAGDVLVFSPAGGGGLGNPHERDPSAVALDVRRNKVSASQAFADYAVVLDLETGEADYAATELRRAELSASEPERNSVINRGVALS